MRGRVTRQLICAEVLAVTAMIAPKTPANRASGLTLNRYRELHDAILKVLRTLDAQDKIPGPVQVDLSQVSPQQRQQLARDPFLDLPVTVTWAAVPGATAYLISRAVVPNGLGVLCAICPTTTTYIDHTAVPGVQHTYAIAALAPLGRSRNIGAPPLLVSTTTKSTESKDSSGDLRPPARLTAAWGAAGQAGRPGRRISERRSRIALRTSAHFFVVDPQAAGRLSQQRTGSTRRKPLRGRSRPLAAGVAARSVR